MYPSIYEKSCSDDIDNPLSDSDIKLFEILDTTNFEHVLSYLLIGKIINSALGMDTQLIEDRYISIQRGLIQAVNAVHIPWRNLPNSILQRIQDELLRYSYVYSTNYDLLIYWAMMHNENGFKDYFWDVEFDIGNTDIWDDCTCVLYLHGGLHLYRLPTGLTLKRRASENNNLLDLFGQPFYENAVPLFISEGSSAEKLSSIYRSDYLSFAFSKFSNHEGPLVILGHSLSASDDHIVSAINRLGPQKIAISMLPGDQIRISSL